jgi:hypothetical protein
MNWTARMQFVNVAIFPASWRRVGQVVSVVLC